MAKPAISSPSFSRSRTALSLAALLGACGGTANGNVATAATFASSASSSDTSSTASSVGDDSSSTSSGETGSVSAGEGCGALTECDDGCVDLDTDVENCGGCGITCAIPNATAECVGGQCALAECHEGWGNCDGQLASGCESESSCVPGLECQTVCGSIGVTSCTTCDPVCETSSETCNAMDDDCNGACDEGPLPGCRVGVHRANGGALGHLYTLDLNEAQSGGFNLESQNFFFVYAEEVEGLQPLHRCLKPNGKRFYTTAANCEGGGQLESILGLIASAARCDSTPLYRVWHSANDAHFYTTSAPERDNAVANLGYTDEGVAGHVWSAP